MATDWGAAQDTPSKKRNPVDWGAAQNNQTTPRTNDTGPVNDNNNNGDGTGGWGGYSQGGGYGSGGSGGDEGPTKQQIHMAKILQPITMFNQDTLLGKAKNAGDVYSIADEGSKNSHLFQSKNAEREAGAEWFSRLLKLQSVASANRDKMGNMAYGSGILDYLHDLSRVQDADAVEVLEALESNQADIDNEYFQAIQKSRNGWNEFAMDTESKLREGAADYITQLANIHPDLATGDYEGTAENEDEGEKWPKTVDIENNTVNVPDWLKTEYYDKNKKGAVDFKRRDFIRPIQARRTAYKMQNKTGRSQSANQRYWDTLTTNYGNRVV